MSSIKLTSDTLAVTPASGELEYNGQFFGTDSTNSRAQLQRIVRATAQASTSGTSIDFTGIPAWVERITVMFDGVSTSGTSPILIQLGDSGGIETTGYVSSATASVGTGVSVLSATNGYYSVQIQLAANAINGSMIISNQNSNVWVQQSIFSVATNAMTYSAGSKTLSATLDRIRITTVNGTDTFDAGSINIMYEG